MLVNHLSANYADFEHFIAPYLDNFGITYGVLDIATTDVLADVGDYAVIIIRGHRQLDADITSHLDPTEQDHISAAVNAGTGLVNFNNDLFTDSGKYGYCLCRRYFWFRLPGSSIICRCIFPEPGKPLYYRAPRAWRNDQVTGTMTLVDITCLQEI